MQHPTPLEPPSRTLSVLQKLGRWRRRNQAIRELRAMPGWRLADLGLTRGQIPAFVDALLQKTVTSDPQPTPSEVQSGRLQVLQGTLADGLAGF